MGVNSFRIYFVLLHLTSLCYPHGVMYIHLSRVAAWLARPMQRGRVRVRPCVRGSSYIAPQCPPWHAIARPHTIDRPCARVSPRPAHASIHPGHCASMHSTSCALPTYHSALRIHAHLSPGVLSPVRPPPHRFGECVYTIDLRFKANHVQRRIFTKPSHNPLINSLVVWPRRQCNGVVVIDKNKPMV